MTEEIDNLLKQLAEVLKDTLPGTEGFVPNDPSQPSWIAIPDKDYPYLQKTHFWFPPNGKQ